MITRPRSQGRSGPATALVDRPGAPEVADDLTRRELVAAGLVAGLLAACGRGGPPPPAAAPPTTAGTRSVVGTNGRVEVPPRRRHEVSRTGAKPRKKP